MQLIQQACIFLLGGSKLGFQLFIPEGGGLDVFIDYFLHLHYLLHYFLHLHWSLYVDWLHAHLPLHSPCCLELACQRLDLELQLGDSASASRVGLIGLFCFLLGPQELCLSLFLGAVQSGVQLFYLLVFSSEGVLHFLHLGHDQLVPLLQLLHAVSQMLVLGLFLTGLVLILFGETLADCRQFLLQTSLPLAIVFAGLASQGLHDSFSFRQCFLELSGFGCKDLIFFALDLQTGLQIDHPSGKSLDLSVLLVGQQRHLIFLGREFLLLYHIGYTMMAAHSMYMFSLSLPRSLTACFWRQLYFSRHISRYSRSCQSMVMRVPQWQAQRFYDITKLQREITQNCHRGRIHSYLGYYLHSYSQISSILPPLNNDPSSPWCSFIINQMQVDRQQKQKYLRENILERQYDAEQFMDFCESYKGSVDIDSWSLQELKEIVQKFVASNAKTIQLSPFDYAAGLQGQSQPVQPMENFDWDSAFNAHKEEPAANLNLNMIDLDFLESMGMNPSPPKPATKAQQHSMKKPQESIVTDPKAILTKLNNKDNEFISAFNANALNKKSSQPPVSAPKEDILIQPISNNLNPPPGVAPQSVFVPSAKDTLIIEENFKSTLKCRTFSNKPKLDGDYQVVVNGHEVINPNPFVPNYVLYTVTTNPIGHQVKRRLKDFQSLRTLLKKVFPSTQIPFLQRCGRLSQTQPNVIKKQKLFLQSFLNSLLMNKSIRCKIIDDFLLCDNLDTLKKNFRDFQKLQKPKAIEDLYSPSGKIELELNAINKKFISQQELYLDYLQPNMMRLKELYDQLLLSFANNVRIMGEISDLYDNIRASTRNVNALLLEQHRSTFLEESLQRVSDLHKHWALSIKTQAKLMQVQIRHLFRYEFDNLQTIRQLCKQTTALSQTYAKRNDKDAAAKEQYEYNKKLADYKIGVDNASKNTCVLRHQAAYYLCSSVGEVKRYFQELSVKMVKKFRIFSVLQMNINSDLDHHWQEFEKFSQK